MIKKRKLFPLVVRMFVFQLVCCRVSGRKSCCGMTKPTRTMLRSWECGVCIEEGYNFLENTCLKPFQYTMDPVRCAMAEDKCKDSSRLIECPSNNYGNCVNLYNTEFQCICKPVYIGNYCRTQKPDNYVPRSEGWVMFLQHTIRYRRLNTLNIVVVAHKEITNKNLPTTVHVSNSQGGNVLFSKPRTKITKDDNVSAWCRVSTTLEEYCDRLQLIIEPKVSSKSLFIANAIYPAVQKWDPLPDTSQLIRSRGIYIGFVSIVRTRVYTGLLKPPFLLLNEIENIILYDRRAETFFNYTDIDMTCIPELTINPETTTVSSAPRFFTNERVYFHVIFRSSLNVNCWKGVVKEWKIWKLKYDVDIDDGVDFLRYGTTYLDIPEYTFRESAAYYVTFHADNFLTSGAKFKNFKGAWFEIMHHPLTVLASIVGKYVNTEDLNKISVDAKDENVRPSEAKQKLEYNWSCRTNTTVGCGAVKKYFNKFSPNVTFPKYSLKPDTLYAITISVKKSSAPLLLPVTRYIYLYVGTKQADLISLHCGCDDLMMLPEELNFIYVKSADGASVPKKTYDYVWEYAEVTQEDLKNNKLNWKSANDLRIFGTSICTFKIRRNSLEYGKTYVFKATVPNSIVFTTLMVNTPHAPYKLDCFSNPANGTRGVTDFDFNCTIPREAGSLYYEFYDKDVDDESMFSGVVENYLQKIISMKNLLRHFGIRGLGVVFRPRTLRTGRMLGYSADGKLRKCKLTAGVVSIFAYDYYRVIARYSFVKIPLVPFNGSIDDLERDLDRAQRLVMDKQYDFASRLASVVSTVLEKKMNPRPHILRMPIRILKQIPSTHFIPTVKMVLSSLQNILKTTAFQFDIFELNADLTKSASDVLLMVTEEIVAVEGRMKLEKLTYETYLELMQAIIDCAEVILMQKNRETMSKPEEYMKPFISDMILQATYTVIQVLEMVGHSLSRTQGPGDFHTELVSAMGNVTACVMVTWMRELRTWTTLNSSAIDISEELANSVGQPTDVAVVMYIKSIIDPFWWTRGQVVTEVLIFNFCKMMKLLKCLALTKFNHRLVLHLDVVKPLDFLVPISGKARGLDHNKMTEEELDLAMTVYRFFLPKRAKMFLEFLINGAEEYRVLILESQRPDSTMMKNAVLVNAKSPEYSLEYDSEGDGSEKIYYMAILPGGDPSTKESLPFRLKAYYVLCFTWLKWYYAAYGCWVGDKTNATSVQCDCNHLSLVASTLAVPEHDLQQSWDFLLFLTPWENLAPLLLLLFMILLYLILLILAILWDKKDRKLGDVIILDDNFPGERYAYLVAVYTGSRINSGTSSFVGIKLFGEQGDSRSHVLTSSKRKVMQAFYEDWFLMYCQKHLGRIRRMLLWHNNEGFSPDWFVDKIEIYDLHLQLQYTFAINDWIAIEKDSNPEAYMSPQKLHQFFSVSKVFNENITTGLRDTHFWTSICLKHPRNPVSRAARIHIIMCFVLVVFALCLVLYLIRFGTAIKEDEPYYALAPVDLLIFFLAYISACPVAWLAMGMFRKAYTHEYQVYVTPDVFRKSIMGEKKKSLFVEEDELYAFNEKDLMKFCDIEAVHIKDGMYRYQQQEKRKYARNVCESVIMAIHKIARGSLLLPVKLPNDENKLIVKKGWCFAVWIFCGVIICICIITILSLAWRLPTVKTEKYLITFLGVVLVDALFIQFLKIILFSAILSHMFQNILPATSYNINPKDGRRMPKYGDTPFLGDLLTIREKTIYHPLPSVKSEEKRARVIWCYKMRLLVDFLMVVVLILVISIIMHIFINEKFPPNDHAMKLMSRSSEENFPSFEELHNRTEYLNYLQITFVNRIYKYMWYTYEPLSDRGQFRKDWTDDCVMRLVGNTRFRQLRVREGECRASGYFKNWSIDCVPSWSSSVEDEDTYTTGWIEKLNETLIDSPWSYVSAQHSNSSRFYGKSATLYPGAGYIAELGFYRRQTRTVVQTLEKSGWLDHRTRGTFVELTLYNVNLDFFTQVVLVAEQHPTGEYVTVPKVASITTTIKFNFWNISFIVFQVFFLFRVLYFMNRNGIFSYLSNGLNRFEVFLLVLGFGTVILYLIHIKSSSNYIEEHLRSGFDEFFSFFKIIRYAHMSARVMYFLFLCVVVKLLLSWRFGKIYFAFFYTVMLSKAWIVWLTLCYTICLAIAWRLIGYSLNVFLYSYLSSILLYKKDFGLIGRPGQIVAGVIIYLMCFISACVITLFVASFLHFYRIGRCYYIPSTLHPDVNFASFVWVEIVNKIRGKKIAEERITKPTLI